jgi:ATP-dependent DNA ligase
MIKILQEIKNTSSTNKKQAILEANKNNELLKKILFYTYNPFYQFYVKKFDKLPNKGELTFKDSADIIFNLLDDLRLRKITGNAAKEAVEYIYQKLDKEEAEVFNKILQKDLKIGINVKLINKVFKNLIPISPYMGAIPYNEKKLQKLLDEEKEVWTQEKLDGMFCNLFYDAETGEIRTFARNGKDLHLEIAFKQNYFSPIYDKFILTGELLIRNFDRYKANGLLNSLKTIMNKKKENTLKEKDIIAFTKRYGKNPNEFIKDIYIVVWDLIPFDDWSKGKCEIPYEKRYSNMLECIYQTENVLEVGFRQVSSKEEVLNHFKEILQKGGEGIIVKSKKGIFENKKPNYQIKVKMDFDVDFIIKDFEYGTPGTKYENVINRVIAQSADGKIKAQVGGLTEDMMDYITKNKNKLIGKICTIKCSGLSWVDGKAEALLHPRFVEIREDKNEADSYEDCVKIEKSILKG